MYLYLGTKAIAERMGWMAVGESVRMAELCGGSKPTEDMR
jgi:hypothetical protein